jgi:hypothetical protein
MIIFQKQVIAINLPRGVATIHAQVTTSHERASVTKQEDRSTTVLLGTRETTKHVLLGPLCLALRELNEQVRNHRRDNVTRRDSVDADVVLAPFSGEVARKLDDGCLASVVSGANKALEYKLSDSCTSRIRKW